MSKHCGCFIVPAGVRNGFTVSRNVNYLNIHESNKEQGSQRFYTELGLKTGWLLVTPQALLITEQGVTACLHRRRFSRIFYRYPPI